MVDYRAIECLKIAVEQQSMEKAGNQLGLTQSAVSQRIKKIEEQYKAPVLVRGRPMYLTTLGEKLISHFNQVRLLEQNVLSPASEIHTPVSLPIAVNNDSIETWFAPVMSHFASFPDFPLRLHIRSADQGRTRDLLKRGEVVACISDTGTPIAGGKSLFLGYMEYVFVATPSFIDRYQLRASKNISTWKAPTLIFDEFDDTLECFMLEHFQIAMDRQWCHWFPSSHGFVGMVQSGAVCALVPSLQLKQELSPAHVQEIFPGISLKVPLYWHWYGLRDTWLDRVTNHVVEEARVNLCLT